MLIVVFNHAANRKFTVARSGRALFFRSFRKTITEFKLGAKDITFYPKGTDMREYERSRVAYTGLLNLLIGSWQFPTTVYCGGSGSAMIACKGRVNLQEWINDIDE